MPAQQSSTNSLVPQYWGQLALLFPIVSYIARSHMFEKKTAQQILDSQTQEGIGGTIGFSSFWGVVMRSIPG